MDYSEKEIDDYLQDYFSRNKEGIKVRIRFLLDNYVKQDYLFTPDSWFCFEETRHSFMMGDFVASIIMSAVTIERYLVFLLKTPFYLNDLDQASGDTLKKLTSQAFEKGFFDDQLKEKILQLVKNRDDFVHGVDSSTHTRPQIKDPILNSLMWTNSEFMKDEIEEKAKYGILTLFEFIDKLHYSKLILPNE